MKNKWICSQSVSCHLRGIPLPRNTPFSPTKAQTRENWCPSEGPSNYFRSRNSQLQALPAQCSVVCGKTPRMRIRRFSFRFFGLNMLVASLNFGFHLCSAYSMRGILRWESNTHNWDPPRPGPITPPVWHIECWRGLLWSEAHWPNQSAAPRWTVPSHPRAWHTGVTGILHRFVLDVHEDLSWCLTCNRVPSTLIPSSPIPSQTSPVAPGERSTSCTLCSFP